jgi:hypothetical protein
LTLVVIRPWSIDTGAEAIVETAPAVPAVALPVAAPAIPPAGEVLVKKSMLVGMVDEI